MCICFAKWPTTLHEHAARFRSPTFPVATYSPRFSTLTLIFALVHSALCLHSVCMLVIHCVFVCVLFSHFVLYYHAWYSAFVLPVQGLLCNLVEKRHQGSEGV